VRLALVLVAACSTNPRASQPDRTKDAVAQASPSDAQAPAPDDAAAPARSPEIDAALRSLWSEHGSDVPPAAWWKAHAGEVVPELRAMLEDGKDDGTGDRWAIRILGDLGDPADVALLAGVLTTWTLETARERAAAALGVHPAPAASDALIAATRDADITIASHAVSGLGSRKGDGAARARLEQLLQHADSTMRFRAVNALAELGGSKPALEKRRKIEKDAEVRSAIAKALRAP
jgi:hypothetical protein